MQAPRQARACECGGGGGGGGCVMCPPAARLRRRTVSASASSFCRASGWPMPPDAFCEARGAPGRGACSCRMYAVSMCDTATAASSTTAGAATSINRTITAAK